MRRQENPFSSQEVTILNGNLGRSSSGLQSDPSLLTARMQDFSLRIPANKTANFGALTDAVADQAPFSDQLARAVVMFPKSLQVQVSEEGVFVPNGLFGKASKVRIRQEHGPNGDLRVVVYAEKLGREGAFVRRRTEKLDFSLERGWLKMHATEYAGQWVALVGNRLLSSGKGGREVYEAALALGADRPFVTQVESPDELPFGGW